MVEIEKIEIIINYTFKNKKLLEIAFLHSSQGKINNERLEFLGDTILDLVVADKLFEVKADKEGDLTKKRANLVCEKNLSSIIKKYGLQKYIVFGGSFKGEPSDAVCGDLFESIVGAIYLDNNKTLDEVRKFVYTHIDMSVSESIDYKTRLQEIIQKKKDFKIEYKTIQIEEDLNIPRFECSLYIDGEKKSVAQGKSKKQAEINSAKIVYENLKGN